jgi:hypothetical protein
MKWVPMTRSGQEQPDLVFRQWPDGIQESRLASSFEVGDPDYQEIMALVAAGELVIAPAGSQE